MMTQLGGYQNNILGVFAARKNFIVICIHNIMIYSTVSSWPVSSLEPGNEICPGLSEHIQMECN